MGTSNLRFLICAIITVAFLGCVGSPISHAQDPLPLHKRPSPDFTLFYNYDEDAFSFLAQDIIKLAAQECQKRLRAKKLRRVVLVGHTDTTLDKAAAVEVSQARSAGAKRELIKRGVPAALIENTGIGYVEPLINLGPNLRESQNRRVEIFLFAN